MNERSIQYGCYMGVVGATSQGAGDVVCVTSQCIAGDVVVKVVLWQLAG